MLNNAETEFTASLIKWTIGDVEMETVHLKYRILGNELTIGIEGGLGIVEVEFYRSAVFFVEHLVAINFNRVVVVGI